MFVIFSRIVPYRVIALGKKHLFNQGKKYALVYNICYTGASLQSTSHAYAHAHAHVNASSKYATRERAGEREGGREGGRERDGWTQLREREREREGKGREGEREMDTVEREREREREREKGRGGRERESERESERGIDSKPRTCPLSCIKSLLLVVGLFKKKRPTTRWSQSTDTQTSYEANDTSSFLNPKP